MMTTVTQLSLMLRAFAVEVSQERHFVFPFPRGPAAK
jgi:hypothetical protein